MKKFLSILILILASLNLQAQTETPKDSLDLLYKKYFELQKKQDSLGRLSSSITTLEENYSKFNNILISNNEAIRKLTNAELFSLQEQLNQRKAKIVNTAEFVNVSNVSLNAIKQIDATSDYLSKVTSLNNPENMDLGFSLSKKVAEVLNQSVVKGEKKINGIRSNKFLALVDNIINSPISESISSAVPVVGALKSVVDLAIGTAVQGDDVKVEDISKLKNSLKLYIEHYEGLSRAQMEFDQNLANLDIRKNALISLLTQYTVERVNTLTPNSVAVSEDLVLTDLINEHYDRNQIERKVNSLTAVGSQEELSRLLSDNRLLYPAYALNQAKFIRDEIDALGKEYISIYQSYQNALENVLVKSKAIGDAQKIDKKIKELEDRLAMVEANFRESVNISRLNSKFKLLMEY